MKCSNNVKITRTDPLYDVDTLSYLPDGSSWRIWRIKRAAATFELSEPVRHSSRSLRPWIWRSRPASCM